MPLWEQIIFVFIITVLYDVVYALYIQNTAHLNEYKAANYSSMLYLMGAAIVISYVDNRWLLIPATFGAWFGTFVTVRWTRLRKEKRNENRRPIH